MINKNIKFLIIINILIFIGLSKTGIAENHYSKVEDKEAFTGGAGTVFIENKNAYSLPSVSYTHLTLPTNREV